MVHRMMVAVVLVVVIGRVIILSDDNKKLYKKCIFMNPKVYTESELELNADGE